MTIDRRPELVEAVPGLRVDDRHENLSLYAGWDSACDHGEISKATKTYVSKHPKVKAWENFAKLHGFKSRKPYAGQFANGGFGGRGFCGEGSEEHHAAPDVRRLHTIIGEWRALHHGAEAWGLKVDCGDLLWHGGILSLLYKGIDLHSRPSWYHVHHCDNCLIEGDAASMELPGADIAIARQGFIHLSNAVIDRILDRLRGAGVTGCSPRVCPSATTSPPCPGGEDYAIEGFPVGLAADSFCLPYALQLHRGAAMRLFWTA